MKFVIDIFLMVLGTILGCLLITWSVKLYWIIGILIFCTSTIYYKLKYDYPLLSEDTPYHLFSIIVWPINCTLYFWIYSNLRARLNG